MELETTQLLDCTGRATHTLTLLFDGSVRIEVTAGPTVRYFPETGDTDPAHYVLPEEVRAAASAMRFSG
jgi:hypothetical protein